MHPTSNSAKTSQRFYTLLLIFAFVLASIPLSRAQKYDPTIGLPITRTYSIEEIGVSRGPKLNFDSIGRLSLISVAKYIVLNDEAWIDFIEGSSESLPLSEVVCAEDGTTYYGALASWGIAEHTPSGKLRTVSLRPENYPKWVNSTNFDNIVTTSQKIVFSGENGLVIYDPQSKEQIFVELPLSTTFTIGPNYYVSSNTRGTLKLDPTNGKTTLIDPSVSIHEVAKIDENRIVGASVGQGLLYFDGEHFSKFDHAHGEDPYLPTSKLESLPDGGFAAAIEGQGLFFYSAEGELKLSLTTNDYRRIFDLAAHEPGIMWLSNESSVQKVLYNDPVSVVDQRSNVIIGWPQVVKNGEKTVIASSGRLYDLELSQDGSHYLFNEVESIPKPGAWAIASNNKHLLIGNSEGVYVRNDSSFSKIAKSTEANRLFFQDEDLCLVIGSNIISAIQWNGSEWVECAQAIEGVGFPSMAHNAQDSLWLELGLNRTARIWYEKGEIHKRVFEDYPWKTPSWVNIGILKNYIILSGSNNQRLYIDKNTLEFIPPPPIEEVLAKVPFTILRIFEDHNGVLWATHPSGVLTLRPSANGYEMDTDSLLSIRDQYPSITLLEGKHAWISTESALYHVDQEFQRRPYPKIQPFLVSTLDGKSNEELYSAYRKSKPIARLPYSKNHLVFRYFSGGYMPLQEPNYRYSMENKSNSWTVENIGSLLTLPSLEEGAYKLTAQLRDGNRPIGNPIVSEFEIAPPWYRSTSAYIIYWSAGILITLTSVSWAARGAKRKHNYLEKLVFERTEELRATMNKLTEEARISATLAERNRLAGEIHDSLQQGLSGIALQLDATLKHDNLKPELYSRLSIARRMVSFTRQEVQQAVWDLESPLLQNGNLIEALLHIVEILGTDSTRLKVESTGEPEEINSTIQHHILRIAQEAITNALRHSEAKQIKVLLDFRNKQLDLKIQDNGKGFNTNEIFADGKGHFGLRGLRTRSSKIQGTLTITSEIGKGTTVHLSVPQQTNTTLNPLENE